MTAPDDCIYETPVASVKVNNNNKLYGCNKLVNGLLVLPLLHVRASSVHARPMYR